MNSRYDKSEPINYDRRSSIDLYLYVFDLCAQHTIINAMLLVCKTGENFDRNDVAKNKTKHTDDKAVAAAATATTASTAMMTTMPNKLIDGIFFLFLISTHNDTKVCM